MNGWTEEDDQVSWNRRRQETPFICICVLRGVRPSSIYNKEKDSAAFKDEVFKAAELTRTWTTLNQRANS